MNITVRVLCLIVALVCFAVAAFGIGSGRFNLIGLGLAFVALAELFG